jgi:hypothetical protein
MLKKLGDLNVWFYSYCIAKSVLYSASTLCIFFSISSRLPINFLATVSFALDLAVIIVLTRLFVLAGSGSGGFGRFLLLLSCAILLFYPISWDDLSYGLVLPHEYLVRNSFEPISEYGIFTYFPFVDYGRTAMSFAFGEKPQIILYRIEGLALYLITFAFLLQIGFSTHLGSKKQEFVYFVALLLMTTVSAFSVYAFIKPESFTTTCFAISALMFINQKASKAIIIALIAIPFKYTAVITGLPIIILSLSKIRKEFERIRLIEIVGFIAIISITALWLFNNYLYTFSPFYPLLMKFFPYGSDGVINGDEYKRIMQILFSQEDVSPSSMVSFKYLKYIATQLGGTLFFLPLFLFVLFSKRFKNIVADRLMLLAVASSFALTFFLLILFSEFRYVYMLVCIIVMTTILSLIAILKNSKNNLALKFFVFLVCLQLLFVIARNFKNSIYDPFLSLLPINLSVEQLEELNCIRSSPNINARTATFEQTFYLWKSPFFFIHELNEYIGLNPSQKNIQYAFQKFNVRYLLLRDEYKDSSFLLNLKIGGIPRTMPQVVLGRIHEIYNLREIVNNSCIKIKIYELIPKPK